MTTYSYGQLEGLWIQAGGPRSAAPLMAAIAMAESRGISTAVNPTSGATGLWQIDPGGPQYLDPLFNAKEAVARYKSPSGLSNWTTYTSGAYKPFLQSGVDAQLPGGGVVPASLLGQIGGAIGNALGQDLYPFNEIPFAGQFLQDLGTGAGQGLASGQTPWSAIGSTISSVEQSVIRGFDRALYALFAVVLIVSGLYVLMHDQITHVAVTVAAPEAEAGRAAEGAA